MKMRMLSCLFAGLAVLSTSPAAAACDKAVVRAEPAVLTDRLVPAPDPKRFPVGFRMRHG